ncbi:amidohydrolase [uncultured Algibacter sp.]|uniref:amidohydrolase n=1 Tax=uncultured Algibacter sp. TaxID=298659 RepID=UPI0026380907|nr:amidohydrolase [uncultured Algibacter sp.]
MKNTLTLIFGLCILISCTNRNEKNIKDESTYIKYYGGEIITIDITMQSAAEAVVTKDDIIVFVGTKSEANKLYPYAKSVDLDNNVMIPGFVDNHLHLGLGAILLPLYWVTPENWGLPNGRTISATVGKEKFLEEVQSLVDQFKKSDQVLQIFGYSQYFHGIIYKEDLDKISTTIPINIFHRSFHENIFNSAALDFYGYTRENMNDPQADFDKGIVLENFQQLDFLYQRWLPTFSIDEWKSGIKQVNQLLLKNGITTIHGPGAFLGATKEQIDATYELFSEASARSYFSYDVRPTFYEKGFEATLNYIDQNASRNNEHIIYQNDQIKLFIDGGMFGQQMMVTEPYTDGHIGEYITEPKALYELWEPFWKKNIDVHIHVNGDQGIDDLIIIMEKLQIEFPRENHRTVFEHFGVSRIEQSEKMAKLGIIASVNPYYNHALGENFTINGVGPESRSHYFSRSGTLAKNNVRFSLHSDFPMAPPSPLFLMWCAVNRLGVSGQTLGPEEKITPYQALKAVTIDAAYAIKQEANIGSIEVGKKADFTILDKNPLKVDPLSIKDIKVHSVVFNGKFYKNKNSRSQRL